MKDRPVPASPDRPVPVTEAEVAAYRARGGVVTLCPPARAALTETSLPPVAWYRLRAKSRLDSERA